MYKIYYIKGDILYIVFLDNPSMELEEMLVELEILCNGSTEIKYYGIET